MLRSIATGVYTICLAAWSSLALLLCMTILGHGWSAVSPKLLHVAGDTGQLGVQSWSAVSWHLAELLLLTAAAGYFRRSRRPDPINP